MIKRRQTIDLNTLIKEKQILKSSIAKTLHITPQWLSSLLQKEIKDLTIGQFQSIVESIGLTMQIYVEDRLL